MFVSLADAIDAEDASLDRERYEFTENATDHYRRCLFATRARYFDRNVRRCEEALHRIDPMGFPIRSELLGDRNRRPRTAEPSAARLRAR